MTYLRTGDKVLVTHFDGDPFVDGKVTAVMPGFVKVETSYGYQKWSKSERVHQINPDDPVSAFKAVERKKKREDAGGCAAVVFMGLLFVGVLAACIAAVAQMKHLEQRISVLEGNK